MRVYKPGHYCIEKRPYKTRRAARYGMIDSIRSNPEGFRDHPVCVYKCPDCDNFHFGRLPKSIAVNSNIAVHVVSKKEKGYVVP